MFAVPSEPTASGSTSGGGATPVTHLSACAANEAPGEIKLGAAARTIAAAGSRGRGRRISAARAHAAARLDVRVVVAGASAACRGCRGDDDATALVAAADTSRANADVSTGSSARARAVRRAARRDVHVAPHAERRVGGVNGRARRDRRGDEDEHGGGEFADGAWPEVVDGGRGIRALTRADVLRSTSAARSASAASRAALVCNTLLLTLLVAFRAHL